MNKIQAVLIVTLLLAVQGLVVMAHGGEDHEEKKEATKQSGEAWFTVNSVSDIFEVVLRYEPLEAGEHAHLKLFISDFVTNAAIDSAKIEITAIEDDDLKFEVL